MFPVAAVGGGSNAEWQRLRRQQYCNRTSGDMDFLADLSLDPNELAQRIILECRSLLGSETAAYSKRVFIVHGRDGELKNELARFLERLGLTPVILHDEADEGRTVFAKLQDELSDVGFAFVLLTPDDQGGLSPARKLAKRARQNVIFEHGLLIGRLGPKRVCALVKDEVELPSDIHGVIYKHIPKGQALSAIAFELLRELRSAGYGVDANVL